MKQISRDDLWARVKAIPSPSFGKAQNTSLEITSDVLVADVVQSNATISESDTKQLPTNLHINCGKEAHQFTETGTPTLICPDTPCQLLVQEADQNSQHLQVNNDQKSFHNKAQPLDISKFPNQPRTGSQHLPTTIANIEHMLTEYGVVVRYNVIRKKLMITLPDHIGTSDNADNVAMTRIINLASLNGLSTTKVPAFIEALADQNLYNPVAEWINSRPWDGKDRLCDICETVREREGYPIELKNILIIKWLLSAVAAALKPSGFKARGVLTFQGPQGIGKTSWIMSLVPDEILREMTVKIDHHLDGGNKDSILGAVTHWIVEIGELDSSFKKDIARLKGFLTSNFDKIRRPYAHVPSEYPRRTVFFASVNQEDFLVDNTGNSRWWTIPVEAVNFQHGIDMQQLFAQLAVAFNNGNEWWLNKDEETMLEQCNKDHRSVSVIREQLLDVIDLQLIGNDGNPAMTATEVLKMLGYNNPHNSKAKECAVILREQFGDSKRIHGINKWRIPLKRTTPPYRSTTRQIDEDMY